MRYRSLGTTGVKVSPLCLGAMMFGAMGNPDHDDCVRIIHRALDAGINFIDTADVYSAGESEEIVGKALDGPPRRRRARDEAARADGQRPEREGQLAPVDRARGREQPAPARAPTASTSTRCTGPSPGTDVDDTLSALSDLVHQGKVNYLGSSTFPAEAIVEAQWTAERRGPRTLPRRAAAVLDLRARHRGVGAADVRAVRHGRDPVEPAQRRLPHRPLPARARPHRQIGRAARMPDRFDPERPGVQRKLDAHPRAGEGRGRRGHAAHAPRDRLHARAPGGELGDHRAAHDGAARRAARLGDVALDDDTLDRIDELVPPGTNVNRGEVGLGASRAVSRRGAGGDRRLRDDARPSAFTVDAEAGRARRRRGSNASRSTSRAQLHRHEPHRRRARCAVARHGRVGYFRSFGLTGPRARHAGAATTRSGASSR